MITWVGMKFKPAKSRSLVLKSGKLTNRYKFKIQGDTIPTLSDNPVKALGKWYRTELNDQASMKETQDQLRTWMNLIGKSGLTGRYKAWVYQHGVLHRIPWPLTLYDPGGGALKAPPPIFCSHAFNFGAALLCVW